MEQIQIWLTDPRYLTALAALLAALAAAFVAGYVLGRAGRPREARHPSPRAARASPGDRPAAHPAPREIGDVAPLPEIGGDEAHLMDLSAIRAAEAEPPPPIDTEPPRLR